MGADARERRRRRSDAKLSKRTYPTSVNVDLSDDCLRAIEMVHKKHPMPF